MANIHTALFVLASVTSCLAVLPASYTSLSATEKQAILWNQVLDTQYSWDRLPNTFDPKQYNLTLQETGEFLAISFMHTGDEQPPGRSRMDAAHFGIVGKITFKTYKNSTSGYTGLLNSGGIGLIRLSLDTQSGASYNPNVGVKILIDGQISRNFHQAQDLIGQDLDQNFFSVPMNNIIPIPPIGSKPKDLAFVKVGSLLPGGPLDRPSSVGNLGIYEQSSVRSDGTKEAKVIAPFKLAFKPNPANAFSGATTKDFRKEIQKHVPSGRVLYYVSGMRMEDSTLEEPIGEIVLDSELLASKWGDESLFFRHTSLAWRPS